MIMNPTVPSTPVPSKMELSGHGLFAGQGGKLLPMKTSPMFTTDLRIPVAEAVKDGALQRRSQGSAKRNSGPACGDLGIRPR